MLCQWYWAAIYIYIYRHTQGVPKKFDILLQGNNFGNSCWNNFKECIETDQDFIFYGRG